MTAINIFQKNWAFTTSDSEKTQIKTGSFGPCYVVSFTSGKFAAMAHIDDSTKVDSIQNIFDEFIKNSVQLKDIKVVVIGGWKEHRESFNWGIKIAKKINASSFENVSTKNMYLKKTMTVMQQIQGISQSEVTNHYHLGAMVDAKTGQTFILHSFDEDLEKEQVKQTQQFVTKYRLNLDIEVPLTQVL